MNVNTAQTALVNTASAATLGTVQGSAALTVLKQAMQAQQNAAAQLIASLPQPPNSAAKGGFVDTYA